MKQRLAAVTLLAASVLLVAWLLQLDVGSEAGDGTVAVAVAFADGTVIQGNVTLAGATAWTALEAFAHEKGWVVEAAGRGENLFVTSIDGQANQGAAGWCYAVWDGEAFVEPAYSAGVAGLTDGDQVRWRYEPQGCLD